MSGETRAPVAERFYRGIWSVLVRWLRVPAEGPTLPGSDSGVLQTFHPAPGFLSYMKFWFWLVLTAVDLVILVAWVVLVVAEPWWGLALAPVALFLAVVPDVIAYIAIHLRYDATWYVMTDRSLRIRRGIWVIQEVTITFENVQNVRVVQGPLQRYFGISNVIIETAGSGGSSEEHGFQVSNQGLIEGISDPVGVRESIVARLRQATTAGLGDEGGRNMPQHPRAWSPRHIEALRSIRDALMASRP